MDPNAALRQLRWTRSDIRRNSEASPDAVAMADLFDALDEWLSKGGFLPDAWAARG